MRSFFAALTIGLIVIGFIVPLAWVGAVITGLVAIGLAPPGTRADGKRRTGGLLGGLWDDIVVGYKMDDCPYCKAKIQHDAVKCRYCGEWVNSSSAEHRRIDDQNLMSCAGCGRGIPKHNMKCPYCGEWAVSKRVNISGLK